MRNAEIAKLPEEYLRTLTVRVPLRRPLTRQQLVIAALLNERYTLQEIGGMLRIARRTVRYHVEQAAGKIPGDGDPGERLVAWYRGASLVVLTGRHLYSAEEDPRLLRLARARPGDARGAPLSPSQVAESASFGGSS